MTIVRALGRGVALRSYASWTVQHAVASVGGFNVVHSEHVFANCRAMRFYHNARFGLQKDATLAEGGIQVERAESAAAAKKSLGSKIVKGIGKADAAAVKGMKQVGKEKPVTKKKEMKSGEPGEARAAKENKEVKADSTKKKGNGKAVGEGVKEKKSAKQDDKTVSAAPPKRKKKTAKAGKTTKGAKASKAPKAATGAEGSSKNVVAAPAMSKVAAAQVNTTGSVAVSTGGLTSAVPTAALRMPKSKYLDMVNRGVVTVVQKTGQGLSLTWGGVKRFYKDPLVVKEWGTTCWAAIKHTADHYWAGTKLLATEIRISWKLLKQVLDGRALTRRERRQLLRTSIDILRVIPFAIFVIIPFMELLLPVALKLFPNMLPSTFETKYTREENIRKQIRGKIEMARFMQDIVEEMAVSIKKQSEEGTDLRFTAEQLEDFMSRLRNGEDVEGADIFHFSRLFDDELTLDNLSRIQLFAMSQALGLPPYGTDSFLRFQLRTKIVALKRDDRLIMEEGLDTLNVKELRAACLARGIPPTGLKKAELRKQMEKWLDLSLVRNVPHSLLIMNSAFTSKAKLEEALTATLSSLPDEIEELVDTVVVADGTAEKYRRLERIIHEEEMIAMEREDMEEEEEFRRLKEQAQGIMDTKELAELESKVTEALSVATNTSPLSRERESLEELKAELEELHVELENREVAQAAKLEDVDLEEAFTPDMLGTEDQKVLTGKLPTTDDTTSRPEMADVDGGVDGSPALHEEDEDMKKAQKLMDMLNSRVTNMVGKLEKHMEKADKKIGSKLNLIDLDRDGVITYDEVRTVIYLLRDRPNEDAVKEILSKLDTDRDMKVTLSDVERLLEQAEANDREREDSDDD